MDTNDIIDEILRQIKQPIWENWYIKQKIGSGAFSAVFKVEAQRTSRRTSVSALKIEPITTDGKNFLDEQRKMAYIENKRKSAETEAEIMYSLRKCPYIVSYEEEDIRELYINGVFEGYYYLIRMEYLNAISTLIHAKRFDFSEKNIIALASDIGNGINAAHKLSIIHRDIKLDNFFVDDSGQYKLGDFNISKKTRAARSFAGTPGYLAPEIYRAKSNIDQVYTNQADIYSFGICLYQLANDLLFPFEDKLDVEEAIDKRMEGVELPPPKNVSDGFARIILKACEFSTEKRYKTLDDFLNDLNRLRYSSAPAQSSNIVQSVPVPTPKPMPAKPVTLNINNNQNLQNSSPEKSNNQLPHAKTVLAMVTEEEPPKDGIEPKLQYDLNITDRYIEFGSYYLAANNFKMPLRWKILAIEHDKALIITNMGIDAKSFHNVQSPCNWENSSIRNWLNTEFYNAAFHETEKQLIVESNLRNYKNVVYRTSNGGNTLDKVFLLSIEEAAKFFPNDESRIVKPTAFARSKGVFVAPNGNSWWWLRSSGTTESYAADVDYGGDVDSYGSEKFFGFNCVRPAVWISLAYLNESKKRSITRSFYNSHPDTNVTEPMQKSLSFGQYFFNDTFTKKPLEWRVLATEGDKALIVTANIIEALPYNSVGTNVTWETCQLRKWLNSVFFDSAFSSSEKMYIRDTPITNSNNPLYNTFGGKITQDKVFLLNIKEANINFSSEEERICRATPYALSKGLWTAGNGASWWWLRSPGQTQYYAADVDYGGDVDLYGNSAIYSINGVRPAMWIDKNLLK